MSRAACLVAGLVLSAGPVRFAAADIHVSPTGDDAAPGTADRPLRTLEGARDAARKATGAGGVTVWLRGGTYPRAGTFELSALDSGTAAAPTVYRAAPGETPLLLAGRVVRPDEARPVSDPAVLKRLPEAARAKVVELDGKALGLKHLGPWPDLVADNGGVVEVHFDGRRLPLARWPNDEPATMKGVLDPGEGKGPGAAGGTFEYRDDRHAAWPDDGVWLTGYWRVPWQIETVRVKAVDREKRTVTLAKPVAGGIGSKFARPNGSGKEPYWVVNLLEELDHPGEWCLDFPTGKLYLWPPADLRAGSLVVSDLAEPAVAVRGASWLTLRGLTLEGGLGDGVAVAGGRGVLVAGCEVRGFGRSGVVVAGGEGHAVRSCDLHHLGDTGVVLEGGDRPTLTPCRHAAENNLIHHVGEVKRVYAAGVNAGFPPRVAVGARVANNRVHDAPHAGVLYGGIDNVLELNDVSRVCLVSDDMGGLYTTHDWTSRGNAVRHNFVHDSPKAHGVYLDDGDSGDAVNGNVFFKVDTGVFVGGGHDNLVSGNVAVDCKAGAHVDARGVARGYNAGNKTLVGRLRAVNPDKAPWKERFPNLAGILDNHPELPTGVSFADNLFVRCGKGVDRRAKADELRFVAFGKNLEVAADPGFVAADRLDFRLVPDAIPYRELPGFKPIPLDRVGPQPDEYRPVVPPAR